MSTYYGTEVSDLDEFIGLCEVHLMAEYGLVGRFWRDEFYQNGYNNGLSVEDTCKAATEAFVLMHNAVRMVPDEIWRDIVLTEHLIRGLEQGGESGFLYDPD
jgi:hypothetical protein